jgi:type II secretory pathway pseudopilin PulG
MPKRVRTKFLLIAVACLVLSVLFAVAAPYLLRRRIGEGSEHSAAQDLQAIDAAVKAYIAEHGTTPPALNSLKGRIVLALSCDASACDYRSYRFHYTASPSSSKPTYSISAQPLHLQGRSFYLDETGVLRYTGENRAATSSDPPLVPPTKR